MSKKTEVQALDPVTNGGKCAIETGMPYRVQVEITGAAKLLFHRWNVEAVAAKADAKKGSRAKKSDDIESYVYRTGNGNLGIPGEYLRQSILGAAKFLQDPRSPRKCALDLFEAGLTNLTDLADLGKDTWDYVDQRRVTVQRNGITRCRPALNEGWTAQFEILVNLPEYITPERLNEAVQMAGRLIGVGDFRPTYGRFQVTKFTVTNI
jgi:hypothetical protein